MAALDEGKMETVEVVVKNLKSAFWNIDQNEVCVCVYVHMHVCVLWLCMCYVQLRDFVSGHNMNEVRSSPGLKQPQKQSGFSG